MKATAQTVIIWLFLVFVAGESMNLYFKANSRANRLENNLKIANEQAEQFRTRDGQQASRLKAQELTISELRRINPQIIARLKNLYIPPRLAQSYTQSSQQLKAEVKAAIKDSIVPASITETTGTKETIGTFDYADAWIEVKGQFVSDTATLHISANDTIFTAIYKGERRHPWAWFLSKRQLTAAATNRNPYISIKVIQSGVIKK